MIRNDDIDFVGSFKIQSGHLRISDPCYDKDTWCTGIIKNVKKGEWEAHMKMIDLDCNVAELIAYHKDISKSTIRGQKWIDQGIEVGVDSGQCGIFDDFLYPTEKTGEYDDEKSFYGQCCKITLSDSAGVLDFGVVSQSGYGDGSYECYTLEDKDGVVGVKIVFITEDEDEDESNFFFDRYEEDQIDYNYDYKDED